MKNPRKSKQSTPTPIFVHFAPLNLPKKALPGMFLYLLFCSLAVFLWWVAIMVGHQGWGYTVMIISLVLGAILLSNKWFDRTGQKVVQALTKTEEEKAEERRVELGKHIQQGARPTPKRRDL